jgi:hypothetical protein
MKLAPHSASATNLTDAAARRRRGRSWAILLVLLGLCVLFYSITIVKMAQL